MLYCEAGRGSSSSIQYGKITRLTEATVFVENSKYTWRNRQSRSPEWDLYKITKEQYELLKNK